MENKPDLFPFFDADKELLSSVGKVVLDFCALENELSIFISLLVNYKDAYAANVSASELSFRKKLIVLKSEYKYRVQDAQKFDQLDKLCNDLRDIELTRNEYFHSFYTNTLYLPKEKDKEGTVQRIRSKYRKNADSHFLRTPISPNELLEFSDKIRSKCNLLMFMSEEYSKGCV
jgi:hypothetical protein